MQPSETKEVKLLVDLKDVAAVPLDASQFHPLDMPLKRVARDQTHFLMQALVEATLTI